MSVIRNRTIRAILRTLSSLNSSLPCFDLESMVCAIISPMYMRKPEDTVLVSSKYLPKSFFSVDLMMSKTNFLIFVQLSSDTKAHSAETKWMHTDEKIKTQHF